MQFHDQHYEWMGGRWKTVPDYFDYLHRNHRPNKKPAVVIDIDGTMKPSHPMLESMDLFPNVIDAFKHLYTSKIDIFVITSRDIIQEQPTRQYLQRCGLLSFIRRIYFQDWTVQKSSLRYKADIRTELRQTHSIIMAIGDQKQDLTHHDHDDEDDVCINLLLENPWC